MPRATGPFVLAGLRRVKIAYRGALDRIRSRTRRARAQAYVRRARRGAIRARHWPRFHGISWLTFGLVVLGDVLLVVWILAKAYFSWWGTSPTDKQAGQWWYRKWLLSDDPWPHVLPNAFGWLLEPLLLLSAALTIFWLWRRRKVVTAYRRRAGTQPKELVPTARGILDEVVGRDELCQNLIEGLRSYQDRQVHVVQGGIGSGKTAVLVELTRQLAYQGAVPVNIRMRDAKPDFGFSALALERFKEEVRASVRSDAEAERMFRLLRRYDQIVVLADGLEEALSQESGGSQPGGPAVDNRETFDRDSTIRLAMQKAQREGLPLVVTTRPYDPLRAMDAVIVELEPLGEQPALQYAQTDADPQHFDLLARLIQNTDVAYAPLYLNLGRRLYRDALPLWLELAGPGDRRTPDRLVDRSSLRLRMLDHWREAMCNGLLYQDYVLSPLLRRRAVELLSVLACVGLTKNSPEVRFDELVSHDDGRAPASAGGWAGSTLADPGSYQRKLIGALATQLDALPTNGDAGASSEENRSPITYGDRVFENEATGGSPTEKRNFWISQLRLAATMGTELGIVEAKETSVRFLHSLMQAYLGSRYLAVAIEDPHYCKAAMSSLSKELLVALEFGSRREGGPHSSPDERGLPDEIEDRPDEVEGRPDQIEGRPNEVEGPPRKTECRSVAFQLKECAGGILDHDPSRALGAYATAFEVDCGPSGGRKGACHTDLARSVAGNWYKVQNDEVLDRALVDARTGLISQIGHAAKTLAPADSQSPTSARVNYGRFYDIAKAERMYPLQLAMVQEIGEGGDLAFSQLSRMFNKRWKADRARTARSTSSDRAAGHSAEDSPTHLRERVVCAWLAPLLYQSCRTQQDAAFGNLRQWVEDLATVDPSKPERQPNIQAEIALAQGFRFAANRHGDPQTHDRVTVDDHSLKRNMLIELAESALSHSRFWFSHLVLIQALTLLVLPDDPGPTPPRTGRGSDPRATVSYWVKLAGSSRPTSSHALRRPVHPFVAEAAVLAEWALTSRRPQHFLWIDESGVVGQVGSSGTPYSSPFRLRQWVLPSVGWATLHPRARRLIADVLVMLNLAERGKTPRLQDERLRRADRADLPPCLTRAREQLDLQRTISSAKRSEPGTNCIDDCAFRLCPYPPVGERPYRAEVSEGLCRALSSDLSVSKWQRSLTHKELAAFWDTMAKRYKPHPGR